ncbi:unnamed protein product [Discosporangium mesarthrocarpum]
MLLAPGNSPTGYGLMGRSASGQLLTWSRHSAPPKVVSRETLSSGQSRWTGKSARRYLSTRSSPPSRPRCLGRQATPSSCSREVPSRTRRKGSWRNFFGVGIIILEILSSNSPNLNLNDLSFFHSIQQLKEDVGVTIVEGLVEATLEAFDNYPGRRWNASGTASSLSMDRPRSLRGTTVIRYPTRARNRPRGRVGFPRVERWIRPNIIPGRCSGGPRGRGT